MNNSEQQMSEIEIPTPNQSDLMKSDQGEENNQPIIEKADSDIEIKHQSFFSSQTTRHLIKILDIVGAVGLLIYCILIQSYYSTFYFVCLLLILNYTYVNHYQGVQVKDGKLYSLEEFKFVQEQFQNTGIEQGTDQFITQYWLKIFDIKKLVWKSYIITSGLSLIVKLILYPLIKNGGSQIMSIENFQGLEIYFTLVNGKISVSSSEQALSFAPNCVMLFLSIIIIFFRSQNIRKEFYEFTEPTIYTKFLIIVMLLNLIILTCFTQSLIGLIMWVFQLVLLFKMYFNQLIDKWYFIILKVTVMFFFVMMYFISTPIKKAILQNNLTASYTLQFTGFQLFGFWQDFQVQAIIFIIFAFLVINILCLINEKINSQQIQVIFKHTIQDIQTQYDDFLQYKKLVTSSMENISFDINLSPQNEKKKNNEPLDSSNIDDMQEDQNSGESSAKEEQKEDDQKLNLSQYIAATQEKSNQIFSYIQEQSYQRLQKIKQAIDKPMITLITLQIFTITIIILQQTYFSIPLVFWVIISGFKVKFEVLKIISIWLNIPSLFLNFFTFYYSNITGLNKPNNFYSFCPSSTFKNVNELPTTICQKLGFFYQDHSILNTILMDITLSLFFLFIRQVDEQETSAQENQIKDQNANWLNISTALFFKMCFFAVIILLYWVGFNEINIIQFILILLLIIFIVNQSRKSQSNGQLIPFQQKYWIILLSYVSVLSLSKYLYILFGKSSNYFIVEILGFNSLNQQWIINWILFYMIVIQYYGFDTESYIKYSNRLVATISRVDTVAQHIPKFRYYFGIVETLFGHALIWIGYAVNLCFLLFTPYSYLNNILLFYLGIVFLYHVKSINSEINYSKLRICFYWYLQMLLAAFAYRYLFSFFCLSDLNQKSSNYLKFYQNLQLYYQEAGLYAYSTNDLRTEYLSDTLNILFGSLALSQLAKFEKLQKLKGKTNLQESQSENVLDIQILDQQKWLKTILIGIAHINTDLITIYIVLSCVFYLRSAAAFILLTVYLSYFYRVHNKILELLHQRSIMPRLQEQIMKLKNIYLEINITKWPHQDEPKQLKHLNDQIKLLRLTTRIKLKRTIWLFSFYFTAFCIFLTYFSQFLSTETFTAIINPPKWVDGTIIGFFVFGTYSRQFIITNQCYCGTQPENSDCLDNNFVKTESNMWQVSWFYLFLLFVNVIDTACTKILEDDLTKSIEKLQEIKEQDQIEEQRVKNLPYEESLDLFIKKYDFITLIPSDIEYKTCTREVLIINFFFNKNRFVKMLLNDSFFKIYQRVLILLYLSNTLLVNTLFSLFYLTVSACLFLSKPSTQNTKLLNSFAIFSILFQYFLYLLNWTPSEQDIPYLSNFNLTQIDFNLMAKTNLSEYWLSFLGFQGSEIMNCKKLNEPYSLFNEMTCETNKLLNVVIVFNCLIVSLIYTYFILLEWLCNSIYRQSIKMKQDVIISQNVLQNNSSQKIIINYAVWRQKNYTFRNIIIQTITMNYHLILLGFVLLLCEMNRSMFNLVELLIVIIFLFVAEFHYKWPYNFLKKRQVKTFYQANFFMATIIVALFTLLKIPNLLAQCVNATIVSQQENNGLVFYCMEAFSLRIDGQIFLMFFIALFFDLQNSNHFIESQLNYKQKMILRAKMVSKGLAYSANYKQYKQILQLQDERNILNIISQTIQQKLIVWTQKSQNIQKPQLIIIQNTQQYPQLSASFMTEQEGQLQDEQTFFRKIYINTIIWMRNENQAIKFMPFHVLMDYILQQNKRMKKHIFIKLVNHLKNDTIIYEQQMEIIDKIYKRFYAEIVRKKDKLNNDSLDEMIENLVSKYDRMFAKQKDPYLQKLEKQYEYTDHMNYSKNTDLRFVHIYDEEQRIIVEHTKNKYPISKLAKLKSLALFSMFLQDIFKYCLINWETITNIFIIFYYFKNYAFLGMIIHIVMFSWALIDQNTKIFWFIVYSVYFFIILIVFVDSMYGICQAKPDINNYIPWYYVLDNSNTFTLFYEIFIIWIVTFQIFLEKSFGLFYLEGSQVENMFQGYIRLKLNNFNKEIVKEIVQEVEIERIRSKSEVKQIQPPEIQQIEQENIEKGRLQLQSPDDEEKTNPQIIEIQNDLERKIWANPEIVSDKYKPGFFEKTLSYEYSRPGTDLYLAIACIQVILFLYMLFFYNFMKGETQNIEGYLKYNSVPASLVLALVFQMLFMLIERYIELKGNDKFLKTQQKTVYKNKYKTQFILKYSLQLVVLTLVVYYVYFNLLELWKKNIDNYKEYNTSIVFYFIFFCAYFYLSALQLRLGYRELKVRNQFLYVYNNLGYCFAQVFYSIPFLYDLKVLMDWTCLYTSLDVFQWFTLEDIHRQLYFTKNQSLGKIRRELGLKIQWIMKLICGCGLVFLISCFIFGPLILFSALNPASEYNPIISGSFSINLVNVDTNLNVELFESSQLFGLDLPFLTSTQQIQDVFNNDKITKSQIEKSQQFGGIQRFQLSDFSNSKWQVSLPLYKQLIRELDQSILKEQNYTFMFNVTFTFRRVNQFFLPTVTKFSYPYNPIVNGDNGLVGLQPQQLIYLRDAAQFCDSKGMLLPNFYIETLRVYQDSATSYNVTPIYGNGINSVQDVFMNMNCTNGTTNPLLGSANWQFKYAGTSDQIFNNTNSTSADGLLYFVICDKFSILTSGLSIITIYTSVIIIISTYLRSCFSGQVFMLEFTEMVHPEDLLLICQAISVARQLQDYKKENLLYFQLIDILRSPELVKIMTATWQEAFGPQYKQLENKQNQNEGENIKQKQD